MSESGKKLTKMDAILYIKEVQHVFEDKKEEFNEFLEVLKDYKLDRTDIGAVVTKVEEILKGYEELILGFNKFLPKGYKILTQRDNPQIEDAIDYVNKIKVATLFEGHPDLVRDFTIFLPSSTKG
ncbi:hypothetical protein VNO78_27300 [Psophocarpus tetragonolobus]|uniref:Uncharacterized protein n=1 Tax=Psophocarpus tetragonolobus TaxID=3891 RepID=A0AAN9XC50_PSOTE